jgi:hypothetical protein
VALPGLGIARIKAKADTGAATSALHAWNLTAHRVGGEDWVRFVVHPLQRTNRYEKVCAARVVDRRWVMNPGGHKERRYIIETVLRIGPLEWPIELTLTNRDELGFRMLLGRSAMRNRLVVDPTRSYVIGKREAKPKKKRKRRKPSAATYRTDSMVPRNDDKREV